MTLREGTGVTSPIRPVRSLVVPGLVAAIAFGLLAGLGFWQLDRLAWKEGLIAKVAARIHQAPRRLPAEAAWGEVSFDADEYRPLTVGGRFRHDLETQVYALIDAEPNGGGGPGYWVITPLVSEDGATVLVNRGFVPMDRRDPATRPEGQIEGVVQVTGLLRLPEPETLFSPGNDPAIDRWFVRDPASIGQARGLTRVAPFLIDADATANPGGLPRGGLTRIAFPNRHLEYAMTWFGLAATLLAVFAAFAWSRLRQR